MAARKPGKPTTPPGAPGQADDPLSEQAVQVLRQFRIVFNSIKRHFQQVESQAGVGGAQLWALSIIQSRPGLGVNDLSQAMDVHQSTASNLVRTLTARGLASAAREGPDKRAVQLNITARGGQVLDKAPGPFAGVLPQALARLDEQTLARMEGDLRLLISALDADEQGAKVPLSQK